MNYSLSIFQLFKIYCKDRDCEKCMFYEYKDCTREFYKYINDNYSDFKVGKNKNILSEVE